MIVSMARGCLFGRMAGCIKEIGIRGRSMEKGS